MKKVIFILGLAIMLAAGISTSNTYNHVAQEIGPNPTFVVSPFS